MKIQHRPDILDTIAHLSNDEVPTPPKLANAMLDLLPAEVWTHPEYRWLDPCLKSGVFLREVAKRLLYGLREWEPDEDKLVEHTFRTMLFGTSITQLTGEMARRSVYCSRDASGHKSIVHFDGPAGNLPFVYSQHTIAHGTCTTCGAPAGLERGPDRENHAYSFIHGTYPTKEMEDMKFDVIVGNPPYQLGDGGGGGGASATPLYHRFVEQAIAMEPKYVVMITPSRWFSGGKGLDEFRQRMLADHRFVKLIDHPTLYDCFPGVKIRGGVSYWLWHRDHDGQCEVTTKVGDVVVAPPVSRYLGAYDVLVRHNAAVPILDKVTAFQVEGKSEPRLGDAVSSRKPFGELAEANGKAAPDGLKDPILVYGNQKTYFMPRSAVTSNADWVDDWKVLLVKAHGTSGREDRTILGQPVVAGPGTACTETYLVVRRFDNQKEAENLAAYMRTRFARFLVSLRKTTQNITKDSYAFVPSLPMDRVWTDEELFARYGLTPGEVAAIGSLIQERPATTAEEAGDLDEPEDDE